MKKKLIAWLLVICMAISLLPAAALADTAAKSGKCGDNVTWVFSDDGTLTISGKGKMWDYGTTHGYAPWTIWSSRTISDNLKRIVIEGGVESIGNEAFPSLDYVESVEIANTVTSIGAGAFSDTKISSINLPNGVTTIGQYAFKSTSLKTITLPDSVTSVGYGAFGYCESLASATLSNGLKKLGDYMFYECIGLKTVVLGKNTETISNRAFFNCKKLDTVKFSDNLINVEEYAFSGCYALKSIVLPDSVQTIDDSAFRDSPLATPNIPKNLKSIGDEAFRKSTFTRVDIPAGLADIGWQAFGRNVDAYYVDENNPVYVMIDGIVWNADEAVIIGCGNSQCKEAYIIGYAERVDPYAFSNCTNLKEIYFLGDVPSFRDSCFNNCTFTAYYPKGNNTWVGQRGNYGGKITWVAYDVPTPKVPSLSITTDAATGKPVLKWGEDDNAIGYVVYRANYKDGDYFEWATVDGTKFVDTKAKVGKTYYYFVYALDLNKHMTSQSAIKSITCDCARPVVSITTNASSGKPSLKWNAVDGATKYEVYRATSKNGTYTKMYTTTSTSYTNSSAVAGTTYYYKVKAICGKSSYGNSAYSAVKSIKCTPAAPSLSISRVNGKPKLSWKAVSGATKYWIYRSTDGKNFKYYDSTTKTSYTNSGAASGTKYYYKVKAVTVVNGKSVASSYSYAKSLVCTPATPNVSITSANGKPKLSWNAVNGATKYWVYRSTDGKNFKYYDSTTKTTYTNNSTTVGTRYYYKVKAVVVDNGTSYASAFSSAKSMTVRAAAPTLKTSAPEGTPSLSWNAVNGATKYWVYRSTDGKEFKYYDSTTKTAYTNKSVDAGKTYYYKVKAVNVVNGTSYASGFSNSVSVLVK